MAQNAQAVAPVRPRKTLTIKTTAKADPSDAPVQANEQPAQPGEQPEQPAQPGEPAAATGRRGRNVGAQMLQLGEIRPNVGTVFGVIGALVAELGTVTRAGLVDAMGQATFANPKARPTDRGWCQGYVAGALRDGILALVPPAPEADTKAEN